MFTTINKYSFIDAFRKSDTYKNNFSYEWLTALFEYLEEYEDSTGTQIEFDMVSLCCDYSEYESLESFQKEYGDEYQSLEDIEYETQVIRIPNSEAFIIQNF